MLVPDTCWVTQAATTNANGPVWIGVKPTFPIYIKTLIALMDVGIRIVSNEAIHDWLLKQRPVGNELSRRGFKNRHHNANNALKCAHNWIERNRTDQVVRIIKSLIDITVKPILRLGHNTRRIATVENSNIYVIILTEHEGIGSNTWVGEFMRAGLVPEVHAG